MEKCERTGPRRKVFVFVRTRMSCSSLSRKGQSKGQLWGFILQQRATIESINKFINLIDKRTRTKGKVSQLKLFFAVDRLMMMLMIHAHSNPKPSFKANMTIPRRRQIPPEWNFIVMQIKRLSFTFLSPHLGHARDGDHQPKIIAF